METLKEIVNILKILGISTAGIAFVVLMIKMAIEPEYKAKYLKLTKHLLIATVLITVSLSIIEIPKSFYDSKIEIADDKEVETTIDELKDKDCQGRETINVDGKWYVVTDTNWTLQGVMKDGIMNKKKYNILGQPLLTTMYEIENISVLRLFSECQGAFKGYFADISYYRDSDGYIFPATRSYEEYQNAKADNQYGGGEGSEGDR